jgi:hypothetical protein
LQAPPATPDFGPPFISALAAPARFASADQARSSFFTDGRREQLALLVPGDVARLDSLMFDRLDYGVRTISQATIVAVPRSRAMAQAA